MILAIVGCSGTGKTVITNFLVDRFNFKSPIHTTTRRPNIGGKIKTLASVIAWLGIVGSIIIGIILMATAEELIFAGIISDIVGSISSWIGSFLLYGFGELVENSGIIAQKTNVTLPKSKDFNTVGYERTVNQTTQNKTESLHKWNGKCQMCDKDNVLISAAVIIDDLGTRHRNVCDDCFEKYNCKPEK